jgi:photosystem II stability/assembly factor-like uncharacterized protein
MDSQDRDESKIRRREEMLARRLGEALDQVKSNGTSECPDAEVIAAYAEQALEPTEAAQWESHFATCARCRKILRVLAASAEPPLAGKEVARLGELVLAARAPVEITRSSAGRPRRRLVDWRTRWLAPALGVAAVLAVWFAMRPPWRATNRGDSTTLIAQAPKDEVPPIPAPAEVDRLSRVAPQPRKDQKTLAAPSSDRLSAKAPSFNLPAGAQAESRIEARNEGKKASPNDGLTGNMHQKEEKSGNPSARSEVVTPAAPVAPPPEVRAAQEVPASAPFPQARAKANAAAPPAPAVAGSASQTATVTESAPLAETTNGRVEGTIQQDASAEMALRARNYQALDKSRPAREFSILLKATSGSILWRAGKGGIIERSADAGKTWASQASPTQQDWLAGAAVSDTVCWLVGRNGAIARTVDGAHWQSVISPSVVNTTSGKYPDWVGVTAMDAQAATITGADQRRYATPDGGQTWRAQ